MKRPQGHRLSNIENQLFDRDEYYTKPSIFSSVLHPIRIPAVKGLITIVKELQDEVEKLKAIVAEVTNTVYEEKK